MPTATAAALTCNRLGLLEALIAIGPAIPSRSPRPVLMNVKLTAGPDGCELLASDLEVAIRHRVLGVQCDDPVSLLLSPGRLSSILKTSDDETIYIAVDEDKCVIRGRRSEFRLPSESADLFPDVPAFAATAYHTVAPADLKRLIRRTVTNCDPESVRYALGGCLLSATSDTMTMVGTDGRRLAQQVVPAGIEGDAVIPPSSVISKRALLLIDRVLDTDDAAVEIAVTDKAVLVRTETATIYARLVEGRYPRYQDVFPSEVGSVVTIDAGALLDGFTSAAIMTSEASRGVDLAFNGGSLRLSSTAADVGSGQVDLEIVTLSGEPVTLTLDPRYAIDGLKALDREAVIRIELIDEKNPVVLKTDDSHVMIIMPLTRDR